MDPKLKQRLVGAIVLFILAVIFIPSILDERRTASNEPITEIEIKPVPAPEQRFSSQVIPLDGTKNKALLPIDKTLKQIAKPASKPIEPVVAEPKKVEQKAGMVSWVVQVAVLSSEKSANTLVNKLKKKGFTAASYEKTYSSSGARYRIRVGPVYDYDESKKLKRKIDREMGLKGLIVRYP
jgi:DedD protein